MIKVVIVDDMQVVREGLKALLNLRKDVRVIGEAANGDELNELLKKQLPDIIFMDIKLPGKCGIELSREILQTYPDLKIIIFTAYDDEAYIEDAIEAGVYGFLPKNIDFEELSSAMNMVMRGKCFYSSDIIQKISEMLRHKNSLPRSRQSKSCEERLTKREKEILEYLCQGYSSKKIAELLNISVRTVEAHRARLLTKANAENTAQLINWAIVNNLYEIA